MKLDLNRAIPLLFLIGAAAYSVLWVLFHFPVLAFIASIPCIFIGRFMTRKVSTGLRVDPDSRELFPDYW